MNRLVPMLGFILLSATVVTLLGLTVYEAWILHSMGGVVVAVVLVGAVAEIIREARRVPCMLFSEAVRREQTLNVLAVVGGALVAYSLSVTLGLGAVMAAGLVALIAALVVPDYAVPIYCGSFVGMTSAQLLSSHWELAIAGGVAATLYVLTACTYPGYGGKLGTIAFAGSVITGIGLNREFIITSVPDLSVILLIVAYAVIAAAVTYWLNVSLGRGPVAASGIVGITGGLVLPAAYPEIGGMLAVMVICASFAGMSSRQRFPKPPMMLVAGLVTGLIFVYSMPLIGGAGGKLGTIAFGSVLAVRGYCDLARRCIPGPS